MAKQQMTPAAINRALAERYVPKPRSPESSLGWASARVHRDGHLLNVSAERGAPAVNIIPNPEVVCYWGPRNGSRLAYSVERGPIL